MDFVQSFAIASVIGASSLGVTAKILMDGGKLKSVIGLEIFTVTAIVEFIAIIVASVTIQMGTTETVPTAYDIAWLFIRILIFFGIAGSFAVYVFPRMLQAVRKYMKIKEIYFGTIICVVLLVSYFAEFSGIHGAIGALLLGVAMSQMPLDEYFETSRGLHSIGYGIFIPIFFAGIGLHFILSFFQLPIIMIIGFLIIIIGVKYLGSFIAAKVARLSPASTVAKGVMAKGAVDLGLLISLLSMGLLENELFSLLVFGTLVMMILSASSLQRALGREEEVKGESPEALIPYYVRIAFADLNAKDVMSVSLPHVDKDTSVSQFLHEHLDIAKSTYLVLDDKNMLLGTVSIREINKIPQKKWKSTKLEYMMNKKIIVSNANEDLFSVIEKMNLHHYDLIPIVDITNNRKVVGIITRYNILQLLVNKPIDTEK